MSAALNGRRAIGMLKRVFMLLGGLAVALAASANPGPQAERRHALIVGNSSYVSVPALENPANDSRDVCVSLKKLGFQTTCVTDIKTKGQFKDVVIEFVQGVKKGDVILFYYAGHGVEMEGQNYLVPTTAEFRSRGAFEDDTVRVNYILEELAATRSRLSVVVLDACRDNPFSSKSRSALGRGLAIPDRAPAGSIIIFPTSPGKVALDSGSEGSNGLFTKHLLTHLSLPGLEVEDMFKRVIEGVKAESEQLGSPQIPWMNLSFTGEFCFAGCVDKQAAAREKQKLEERAKELEQQLALQQQQSDQFRTRMKEMEARLAEQQRATNENSEEFRKIEAERRELAKKVAMLENQDQGLKKAQQTLVVYRNSRTELESLERELDMRQQRLKEINNALRTTRSTKGTVPKSVKNLRAERDDLQKQIYRLQSEKKKLESIDKELSNIARIAKESEEANKELAAYRDRLAALEKDAIERERQLEQERALRVETEEKLRDAKRATVRGAATVAPSF